MQQYIIDESLEEKLKKDFPELQLFQDREMLIYEEFLEKVFAEEKTTTIRYKKGFIRYPFSIYLSLFQTSPKDKDEKTPKGTITLQNKLTIKKISELTNNDANKDGFKDKEELLGVLGKIYGSINPEEFVSIYHIDRL